MAHLKIDNPSKGAVSAACLKQPIWMENWIPTPMTARVSINLLEGNYII
jgi:hypothetical protein